MKQLTTACLVVITLACGDPTADTTDIDDTPADVDTGGNDSTRRTKDASNHSGVAGVAKYLKRIAKADGSVTTNWRPIKWATIRMEIDSEVYEQTTNGEGEFSFSVSAPPGTNVELIASTTGPRRNARVVPGPDKPTYAIKKPASNPMVIEVEEPFMAGAFNITNAIVQVSVVLKDLVDEAIPEPLLVRWGPDYISPCISCYHADTRTLDLTGQAEDEDAHDDSVLFHELGHYVEATYGQYDNPEMPHDIDQKVVPTLAWSEGFATWFQGVVLNSSIYVDLRPNKPYVFNLETPPKEAMGTSKNSLESDHSESLVYGLLWDLTDNPADDDDNASFSASDVIQVALTLLKPEDFGYEGADLADFINRWRCLFADRDDALSKLLTASDVPHDFNQDPVCL